jgi:hypothetical protein
MCQHELPNLQEKNPDVVKNATLSDIFDHDFWGTPIGTERSHKSYRPVTVSLLRAIHVTWTGFAKAHPAAQQRVSNALVGAGWAVSSAVQGLTGMRHSDYIAARRSEYQPRAPAGAEDAAQPLPFHVASTLLHAASSCWVLLLALRLFAKLQPGQGGEGGRSSRVLAQATTAAMLFAVHPVHAEVG